VGWKNGTGDVTPIIAGDGINKIGNTVSVDFNEVAQKEHSHVASDITNLSYNDLLDKPESFIIAGDGINKIENTVSVDFNEVAQKEHSHVASDITNLSYNDLLDKPESLPANGGNSDTVDNKHVNDLIFDRLRQQLVCNELSRIVSDPSNIRRLLFFDETGAVNTIKDRVAGNNAYLSANASQLSPDIVGNARVLNFSNNATWELDPWVEYNASSGNLPNSPNERYPWDIASASGTVTETISAGKLTLVATVNSTRYYRREINNKIPAKTKSIEAKAVFGTSGTSDTLRMSIYDGLKGAIIRIYKNGDIKILDSSTYVTITTGLNVTSDFVLKLTLNNTDGLKVYFNGVQQGSTIAYSSLYTTEGGRNFIEFGAGTGGDEKLDLSIYYVNYMLDTSKSLSFTDGAGNDLPFSLVWCGKANTTSQRFLLHKRNPDLTNAEYSLSTGTSTSASAIRLFKASDPTVYIGRTGVFNATEEYSTIISTYSGSKTSAGLKLYGNGVRIDDTDSNIGNYAGMTPTNSKVTNNRPDYVGDARYAVIAIIAEELSATQCKQIDAVLRAYCGIDAVTV